MNHFLYIQCWRLPTVQNLHFLANNSNSDQEDKKTAGWLMQDEFAQDPLALNGSKWKIRISPQWLQ